jgi:hypothetical protein
VKDIEKNNDAFKALSLVSRRISELEAEDERRKAENAKLRELVLCLLSCSSDTGDACDKCPVNGGAGIWDSEDFCDSLIDRVHEMRIEVGG